MSKHTPAPWKLEGTTTICNADQTVGIAHISTYSTEPSEAEANARLIAAAPELLEALQKIVAIHMESHNPMQARGDMHEAARAAIAKAEGGAA